MKSFLSERGAALVIALLVLLVLSFLEVALIVTTTTETKISSTQLRDSQALEVAEAGIEEVITRMALDLGNGDYIGDASLPLNKGWVTVVHLNNTPNDTSGDTVYSKSTQLNNPEEQLLHYSTTDLSDSDDLLIVRHKTGGTNGDSIYFCDLTDRSQYLEAADHGGFPVDVIEVTGRKGDSERKIVAEVSKILLPVSRPADAALYIGDRLDYKDMPEDPTILKVCGHAHRRSLPLGPSGDYDPPNCDSTGHKYHADPCVFPWEGDGDNLYTYSNRDPENCDPAGCVVGIKFPKSYWEPTVESVELELYGNPAWEKVAGLDTTTFPSLWQVLGFATEEEMNNEINWTDINSADDARGMCRVTVPGDFVINSSDSIGWGVLWVRGNSGNPANLRLSSGANYTFRGLLYVEGYLKFPSYDSELRVLGSTMLRRGAAQPANTNRGKLFFLYSSETIGWYLMEELGLFEILSWREK